MLSLDFVYGFFQPALVIRWLHIFWVFLSVHSACILFHGQVEHEFWWGSESMSLCPHLCVRGQGKMSSLPSSVCYPPFFIPLAVHWITWGSRPVAWDLCWALCSSAVRFSCAVHAICWIEGETLHWSRNCPVPSIMLRKLEMEIASALLVIHLVNLCLVSSTWVTDNPMCRCCYMRTIHWHFRASCARCICEVAEAEGKRKRRLSMLGFMFL